MKMIEVSEDALESIKRMAREDAKDAARYREMVSNDHTELYCSFIEELLNSPDTCGKEEFDAAIDAAMQAKP